MIDSVSWGDGGVQVSQKVLDIDAVDYCGDIDIVEARPRAAHAGYPVPGEDLDRLREDLTDVVYTPDPELMARLKALGYVASDDEPQDGSNGK